MADIQEPTKNQVEKIVAAVKCEPRRKRYDFFGAYDYYALVGNLLEALANPDNGLDNDDRHNLCEEATNILYILRTGAEF